MCTSLYIKANGEVPCWDDVGEDLTLRRLDELKLQRGLESSLFSFPQLLHIRRSFMEGRVPFPGVCDKCAVRGHGTPVTSLRPTTLEVLHFEASYLCHLSCPQCIPAEMRHSLQAPPYNMSLTLMESVLKQLKSEGINTVQVIHFEGRGDPLMNAHLPEMIQVCKKWYPAALTMATTHGSYPCKPWLLRCGLDILRVSIDGAFPDSYSRYRVGGDFNKVMEFLTAIRDERRRTDTGLLVIWKYILFEWNDSDEELMRAAELAHQMEVQLSLVLTHSPGRSQRLPTPESLRDCIHRLKINASHEETFQLKTSNRAIDSLAAEKVVHLLKTAAEHLTAYRFAASWPYVALALAIDPGITNVKECGNATVRTYLPEILKKARFPSTLSWLAEICRRIGDRASARLLLRRYLEIAPDAPDWNHVWSDLAKEEAGRSS